MSTNLRPATNLYLQLKLAAARPESETDEEPRRLKTKDILGEPNRWYDFVGPWGHHRAGRAAAMSRAIGEEPPLPVRKPMLNEVMYGIPAAGLGGAAGYFAGTALDRANGFSYPQAGLVGTVAGGLAGLGAGALLSIIQRRRDMREIARKFDAAGVVRQPELDLGIVSGMLGGGYHQHGQISAAGAIADGKPYKPLSGRSQLGLAGAELLATGGLAAVAPGLPSGPLLDAATTALAQVRGERLKSRLKQREE